MSEPLVFIPAAGRGQRLRSEQFNLAKPLVSIGSKPLLYRVLQMYPKGSRFVIATGYQSDFVRQVADIAAEHLGHDISFVYTDSWKEEQLGLSRTIIDSKAFLTEPFIFHAVDTLLEGTASHLGNFQQDTVLLARPTSSSTYRYISEDGNWSRAEFSSTDEKYAYIGLSYISNPKIFFDEISRVMYQGEEGEVIGLNSKTVKSLRLDGVTWFDCGTWEGVYQASKHFSNESVVLPRSNEAIWKFEETMYKFHVDVTFISNRVKRGNALSPFCPNTIMVSPNIYCYKFIHGNTLSKENAEAFSEFLNFCKSFWVINDDVDIESRQTEYLDFYKVKSERRISDFLAKRNPSAAQSINNWSVKPLESLLENVNWHLLSNIKLTRVHGDLHHENVIKCGQRDFKFLDWRSDMAGYTDAYGDPYYDLAKIMHGIIVSHEVISSDRFSVHESHGEVELRIESRSDMKELLHIFIRFLHFNNYEIDRVLILTALIYLNIASLHHDPYDKFLFYLGHVLLQTSDDLNSFMAVLNTLDDKNSLI